MKPRIRLPGSCMSQTHASFSRHHLGHLHIYMDRKASLKIYNIMNNISNVKLYQHSTINTISRCREHIFLDYDYGLLCISYHLHTGRMEKWTRATNKMLYGKKLLTKHSRTTMICIIYEDMIIWTAIYNLSTTSLHCSFVAKNHSVKVLGIYSVSNIILPQ